MISQDRAPKWRQPTSQVDTPSRFQSLGKRQTETLNLRDNSSRLTVAFMHHTLDSDLVPVHEGRQLRSGHSRYMSDLSSPNILRLDRIPVRPLISIRTTYTRHIADVPVVLVCGLPHQSYLFSWPDHTYPYAQSELTPRRHSSRRTFVVLYTDNIRPVQHVQLVLCLFLVRHDLLDIIVYPYCPRTWPLG